MNDFFMFRYVQLALFVIYSIQIGLVFCGQKQSLKSSKTLVASVVMFEILYIGSLINFYLFHYFVSNVE